MRLLAALALLIVYTPGAYADNPERWVVYYGDSLKPEVFSDFDVIVFDAAQHPDLAPLKAQGKTVLGYLSLGEAEEYRPYYKRLKAADVLLTPNKQWKGHRVIDLRNNAWEDMVLDELVPKILADGFDGVMFDTLDSPLQLELDHYKTYDGMSDSALHLLSVARAKFPEAKIMVNRGFEIFPQAAPFVDMIMAESVRADIAPKGKKPFLVEPKEYDAYVKKLKDAQFLNPKLKVYTLDYWDMKDKKGAAQIYADERAHGFIPYVSTVDLQKIYPEPKP